MSKPTKIKIVILAAGSGRRLKLNLPKALVDIGEKTSIMDYQLAQISRFFPTDDITVVLGYKKDRLMERFHDLSFVYNNRFDVTNTAKSLLQAVKKLRGNHILWLNGDVVFAPDILKKILENTDRNLISVNCRTVASEEVKYTLDDSGRINAISKEVSSGLGEAVGINFVRREDVEKLISELDACAAMDYFEKAVETGIKAEKFAFFPLRIGENFCVEVDFPRDLEVVRSYFKTLRDLPAAEAVSAKPCS